MDVNLRQLSHPLAVVIGISFVSFGSFVDCFFRQHTYNLHR